MDTIPARELSQQELGRAIAATWPSYWLYYAERLPTAKVLRHERATAVSFGLPHPLFNQVVDTHPDITPDQFTRLCQAMNERGMPWMWTGIPDTEPDFLARMVETRQMPAAFCMPGMALDLRTTVIPSKTPATLTLREATDAEGLIAYSNGVLPAHEMPTDWGRFFTEVHDQFGYYPEVPARLFYGEENGKPVTGSMVFFTDGVACIQCVGTLPEARGKGYATAAVWACIRAALEAGFRYVVLQASTMGEPIYERMGFRVCYRQCCYMPAAEQPTLPG